MNRLHSASIRKSIAFRRNQYKRDWNALDDVLSQLRLCAVYKPLAAEDSVEIEGKINQLVSVSPSAKLSESQKVRELIWLRPSLERFLVQVESQELIVSLPLFDGLLFETEGFTSEDGLTLLKLDGDTVVICTRDVSRWAVLDINEDAIEGHFFELNVCL